MAVFNKSIELISSGGKVSYFDITDFVNEAISESDVKNGICVVISPHTTCSVFFEEFVHDYDEDGYEFLQADLNSVLEKLVPDQTDWETYKYPGEEHIKDVFSWPNHESYIPNGDTTQLWNGDAHLKATLLGSSQTFEVLDGKLGVGKTGYIYFVDFDRARSRKRNCKIVIIGE